MAKKYTKPTRYDFDLIVIGAGSAGSVAANEAATKGKKVAIIEKDKVGGECPNVTCVPTKALLETVKTFKQVTTASRNGVSASADELDSRSVEHWVKKAVNSATYDGSTGFSDKNIKYFKGSAKFINPWFVSVNEKRISSKKILIATGALASVPSINGLAQTGYLTYQQLALSQKYPDSVCFLGGGAVAYEYAQILSAFGTKVHIIEKFSHILPSMDLEVGDMAADILRKLGTVIHTGSTANEVGISASGKKIIAFKKNDRLYKIEVDEIVVSTGKSPNIDLSLENASIKHDQSGVLVNHQQRTNQKHIYAAGEACGHNYTATGAIKEARVAVNNMFARKKFSTNHSYTPLILYGQPEIAIVGVNEKTMKMTGKIYQTSIAPIGILGKSITSQYNSGFVKIIATYKGTIIGATVVAPHASEIINLLSFAVKNHTRACDLASLTYPMPSWSEAIRVASSKIYCI